MGIRLTVLSLTLITWVCSIASAQVTVQSEDNVLPDGSAFLWVEAETFLEDADQPEVGFIRVDKRDPIQTITEDTNGVEVVAGGLDVLPEDTNASGGAGIFAQLGGGGTATWQMQFAIPATYYMYIHWSMYNRDGNTNYGNEDSFYVPPDFNLNSRDDWLDFEGTSIVDGDEKIGDSNRDGYIDGFPTIAQKWVSEGGIEAHNSTDEEFYDGQFHWYLVDRANEMNQDNAFVSFDGHAIQYEVTEDNVGSVLDFQISYREPYGAIDGLLFSTSNLLLEENAQEVLDDFFLNLSEDIPGDFDRSGVLDLPDVNLLSEEISKGSNNPDFDVTGDGSVNGEDLSVWVKDLRKTWFGDANLDDEFNSGDLVQVFGAGKYETGENATWDEGDWNADLAFNSSDLVAAFGDGGYEQGPPPGANPVPEPSAGLLGLIGLTILLSRRGRDH